MLNDCQQRTARNRQVLSIERSVSGAEVSVCLGDSTASTDVILLDEFVSVCRCKADEAEQPDGIRYDQIGSLVSYLFASGYRRKLILQNNQMEITDGRFQVRLELLTSM